MKTTTKSNNFLCIEDVFCYTKCKTQCEQCKEVEENDENFKQTPFEFTRASFDIRVNKQGLFVTVPSDEPPSKEVEENDRAGHN